MISQNRFYFTALFSSLAVAGLAGCGGGSTSSPAAPVVTTVSGQVVKGPVNGSRVCAFRALTTGKGEELRCTTSDGTGAYQFDISFVGDIIIEALGGSYIDEATNVTKTLSDPMQAVIAAGGGNATGIVTPLTAAAYALSRGGSGGVTSASYSAAAASLATQLKLGATNLTTTRPVVTGSLNDYGRLLRAVSQFVANGNSLGSVLTFCITCGVANRAEFCLSDDQRQLDHLQPEWHTGSSSCSCSIACAFSSARSITITITIAGSFSCARSCAVTCACAGRELQTHHQCGGQRHRCSGDRD
jgi:hypothetical protein